MKSDKLRIIIATALLLATAGLLQAHRKAEVVPQREPLDSLSRRILDYDAKDIPIRTDILEVLGKGEFLSRIYQSADDPYFDLFIAYFASQRTGDTIHSPKNCLPGSGWTPIESRTVQIPSSQGSIPANLYVIAQGQNRQLVLYWYQAHGRAVASEYWAKFYLVADSIRMNRTDGAMVRVTTPILLHEPMSTAEQRTIRFAQHLLPELSRHIPN